MIKDITIGQFFPGTSVMHRLDARMKIILTAIYIASIFVANDYIGMALVIVSLIAINAVSKIPFKVIVKGIKPLIYILIFTSLLNLIYIKGDIVFQLGILKISRQGIITAIFMAVRIICLVISSSLLTYTTSPTMLTDGIELLFSPLKHIKVDVHSIAMMMTIALRFIPTLIEEIDKIMSAQKARGADMESGNLIQRAKALIPILIPLFISSFRRASELAFAMECRCYHGGEGRTRMKQMHFGAADYVALAVILALLAAVILLRIFVPKVI